MTGLTAWRRRVAAAALAGAAVVLVAAVAGCSGRPYVDYEPGIEPTAAKPEVAFHAGIAERDGRLVVDYRLVNRGDTAVVVFDGVPPGTGGTAADPDAGYVTAREDGAVEISRRVFPVPDGVNPAGLELVLGTTVPPGDQIAGRLTLRLPLTPRRPYQGGLEEGVALPDPVRTVVFCLGAARGDAVRGSPVDGSTGYRHDRGTAQAQHLFCSAPRELTD